MNNEDILDLCRLQKMEEKIVGSTAVDRKIAMKAINREKHRLVRNIINNPPPIKESKGDDD